MTPLLVVTHLLAAGIGGLGVRWWMVRHLRIREIDGHAALELHHDDDGPNMTIPDPDRRTQTRRRSDRRSMSLVLVVVLVASMLVILIGVFATIDNARRDVQDRRDADQARELAAVQRCVNDFTTRLAATYTTRAAASNRLENAQAAKDSAQDEVFRVVFAARSVPPTATEKDFDAALARVVRTARHLRGVKDDVARVRATHPLPNPGKVKACVTDKGKGK